ncbi:uncharacterized protein LOC141711064 [Apium graveolens]|uniref:uncharacterized protein LOC141711064 n=1 Tax=Apium graveolens TaxID=4045 RepID=UPI003D7AD187
MSSGHMYAKEFKPPIIKPFLISGKDLFNKRCCEEKSTKTGSSKAPLLSSPLLTPPVSPTTKKVRVNPSATTISSDVPTPLLTQRYAISSDPASFAHLLGDMVLPQSYDGLSAKGLEDILEMLLGTPFMIFRAFLFLVKFTITRSSQQRSSRRSIRGVVRS